MNRLFTKIIFITAVSIAGFLYSLLLLPDRPVNRPNLTDLPTSNASQMPHYITARDFNAWPTGNILSGKQATINADSLKGTDWYQTVMADIEKKTYYMASDSDGRVSSINVAQGLAASYRADGFTLTPLQPLEESRLPKAKSRKREKEWQLELKVKGLYADGKLACIPQTTTRATLKDGEANFCTAEGLIVQYQNTDAGVRQNFIVPRAPAVGAQELRVALQAPRDWEINQVTESEVHFARRTAGAGLSTKIVYKDLVAWDANGQQLAAYMEQEGHSLALVVAAVGARYPVTIDPLSTTANSSLTGPSSGSNFGYSVSGAGDVNGDGYSDVIVGAYGIGTGTGAAYVYHGSATGLSTTAAATLAGPSVVSLFGFSVADAGDVNGDGYSDVIVGAYNVASATGAVYVYHGSAAGLFTTAVATLNGNAYSYFGYSVSSTGDVNGDGYSDVIVGAYGVASNTGRAYVYHGSAAGLSTNAAATLNGTANSYFGISVSAAGDVNGDGYSDVIVGALGTSSNSGSAFVYHGSSTGINTPPATSLNGVIGGNFGHSVSSAGDINGDGYSDVIVGAPTVSSNTGAAYVYHGSPSGLSAIVATTFNGTANSFFGNSVSGAGDVNGDGYSDVVVGANNASGTGEAYVYHGSTSGLSTTGRATLTGSVNSYFGLSVSGAGDVNGDGYSDMIVGAYGVSSNTGNAYLYHGSAGSNATTAAIVGVNGTHIVANGAPVLVVQNSGFILNGGSFFPAASTLKFTGNQLAVLVSGNPKVPLYNLTLDKPVGILVAGSDLNIVNQLTLTSGTINLGGNDIDLGATGSLVGENSMNYVSDPTSNGQVLSTAVLNGPDNAMPGNLGLSISSSANMGNTRIARGNTLSNNNQSIRRYFTVVPANNSNLNATVVFQYLDGELNSIPEGNLVLYQSIDGGLSYSMVGTGTVNQTANTVAVNGLDSFGKLTLGGNVSPLPLQLISFTGKLSQRVTNLSWHSLNEKGLKIYEVERSADAIRYIKIGEVEAQQLSDARYAFTDLSPYTGANYYRLRITGNGSPDAYSGTVRVYLGGPDEETVLYPNPVAAILTAEFSSDGSTPVRLLILDAMGKVIAEKVVDAGAGRSKIVWNLSALVQGNYYLQVAEGKAMRFTKL